MIQPSLSIKFTGFFLIIVILVVIGLFLASRHSTYSKMNQSENTSSLAHFWFSAHSWIHNHWNNAVKRFHDYTRYRREDHQENSSDNDHNDNELYSLTPEYRPEEHKLYVKYLVDALEDNRNHNIALTGIYGSGKSSILQGLREDPIWGRHTFTISLLATLIPHNSNQSDNQSGTQFHAISDEHWIHGTLSSQAPQDNSEEPITLKLQKAIVKQLVFANKPSKAYQSRYTLAHKPSWIHATKKALLVGIFATILIMSYGHNPFDWLLEELHIGSTASSQTIISFILSFGLACGFFYLAGPRMHISEIAIDRTSVAFDKDPSYLFKDSLDEVIYFFETNPKYSVVIFEDLDRSGNPQIFYDLRELNTLINNAPSVHQTVRFIYAIKDSIFNTLNQKDENQPEVDESKFFDLRIPVIPFMASEFLPYYVDEFFPEAGEKTLDVLQKAAPYITDMRLFKTIANTYRVQSNLLFAKDSALLSKNDDKQAKLLAMVLYEIFDSQDYERIPSGKSKLDSIRQFRSRLLEESANSKDMTAFDKTLTVADSFTAVPPNPAKTENNKKINMKKYLDSLLDPQISSQALTRILIEKGYIDQDYILYAIKASTSANVIKYIYYVYNQNGQDQASQKSINLTDKDIETLDKTHHLNYDSLSSMRADILKYLIEPERSQKHKEDITSLIKTIDREYESAGKVFLLSFLCNGGQTNVDEEIREEAIIEFAKNSTHILDLLTVLHNNLLQTYESQPSASYKDLLQKVLPHISDRIIKQIPNTDCDNSLRIFDEYWSSLQEDKKITRKIHTIYHDHPVKQLNEHNNMFKFLIANGLYAVTDSNIRTIFTSSKGEPKATTPQMKYKRQDYYSLNHFYTFNKDVYQGIINNLYAFGNFLKDNESIHSLVQSSDAELSSILADIYDFAIVNNFYNRSDTISTIINHATCRDLSLSTLLAQEKIKRSTKPLEKQDFLTRLFKKQIYNPTFGNVIVYLKDLQTQHISWPELGDKLLTASMNGQSITKSDYEQILQLLKSSSLHWENHENIKTMSVELTAYAKNYLTN